MKNLLTLLALLSCYTWLLAQETDKKPKPIPDAEVFTSEQTVTIDGKVINLTTNAGTMQLRDENNKAIANFGFTSYTKKGVSDVRERPIVFAFNGGPGSSSFWLHMGILGPKRIVVNDPENTPAAPYNLVNNEYSILEVADLVMLDPVGTGLSVPVGEAEFKDFWSVDGDIRSISLFITQYLIKHGRLNSPKYLLGESYGTFRNAGIMKRLLNQGIAMNGVIMVSAVFDLRTLVFPPQEDISYIVHFPTYAATAWYHDQIENKNPDLDAFLDEIRAFTAQEYVPALFKGDQITTTDKEALVKKLAAYTGTSADYWVRANLRVSASEFFVELLRDEGEIVGRLDSRFTGINPDLNAQDGDYDPQSLAISPAYITSFLDYFHGDLGVRDDLLYSITAGRRKGFKWDWKHEGNYRWGTQAAISTSIDMAEAMTKDPNMKVLILNGIYDLATVFYGVEHTINHMGLTKEVKDNIIMKYYEAGHMMYTHPPSMKQFDADVDEFIRMTSRK